MTNKKDKTRASSYPQKKSNTAQQLMEHGKIPPQAVDLEEAVLGACLLEKGAYDEIAHILDAECFYLDKHQRIFQSIARLAAAADPVDILTVTNDLKQTGELEMVGGPYYITTLTSRIALTANI